MSKSEKEKIYLESAGGNVTVSSSRVVLGDKNYVLRNIASVQVYSEEQGKLRTFGLAVFCIIGTIAILSGLVLLGIVLICIGLLYLLFKDKHYVEVSSGGTPTRCVKSPSIDFPNEIVEAINNALLDLDKNRTSEEDTAESGSSNSPTDEILKLKQLLDAGAITQEEYDTKKKELLGL